MNIAVFELFDNNQTLLLQDETRNALQVKTANGDWMDANPVPGALVVNIGDMMEVWTEGLYKSTLHRVVHKSGGYRVSVPFFCIDTIL